MRTSRTTAQADYGRQRLVLILTTAMPLRIDSSAFPNLVDTGDSRFSQGGRNSGGSGSRSVPRCVWAGVQGLTSEPLIYPEVGH